MIACIALWFVEANICLCGTVLTRRRFEEILPAGALGLTVLAYIGGLFGALHAGVLIALALGVALGVLALILILSGRRKFEAKRFFTPAFFAYLALLGIAAYCSFQRAAWQWDEFSHWAIAAKAMSLEKALSTNPACHILFRAYPPGAALHQYLYQAVGALFTGEPFTEWLLYFGYNALCLALLMPFLRLIDKKPWLYTPLAAAMLALLPLWLFSDMYASLYVDGLLALLAVYALGLFRFGGRGVFDTLLACLALTMLTLVKDAGLFFAILIPLLAFLGDWAKEGRRAWRLKALLPYLACFAAVALAKWSWQQSLRLGGVEAAFSAPVELRQLWRILSGAETGYQHTILINFIQKFFSPALHVGSVPISFCMIFAALAVLNLVLFWLEAARGGGRKRAYAPVLHPLWITGLYILGLGILYLFKFGEYEGVRLASYARYVKIGFIFWALMLLGEWLYFLFRCARRRFWLMAASCLIILAGAFAVSDLGALITRKSAQASVETVAAEADIAAKTCALTGEDARIYVLTQALEGYEYYQLRYLLYPRRLNEHGFSIGEPFYEGDIWTERTDCAVWRETLLSGYDYVLVDRANAYLNTEFAPLFPAGAIDGALYRVDKETGLLRPVEP